MPLRPSQRCQSPEVSQRQGSTPGTLRPDPGSPAQPLPPQAPGEWPVPQNLILGLPSSMQPASALPGSQTDPWPHSLGCPWGAWLFLGTSWA